MDSPYKTLLASSVFRDETTADRCEAAYRRGAQQAVALGLTKEDASWYRHYGFDHPDSGRTYKNAVRMPEQNVVYADDRKVNPRKYAQHGKCKLVRAIEMKGGGLIQKIAWTAGSKSDDWG